MNVTGQCKHSLCLNCTWASSCRRKREEMQLRHRYCLLWYLFQLHYDNTDMLRWSCRRRGWCGVCVCVYVGVCVFGEPVSKFIFNSSLGDDLVHSPSYRSTSYILFDVFASSPFLSSPAASSRLVRHLTGPTASVFTFSTGCLKNRGGNERKTSAEVESCMRDGSSLIRGEESARFSWLK